MVLRSPLAPGAFPSLPPIAGVRVASTDCGLRYKGRSDLLLIALAAGSTVGGVLTRSKTASAPVEWCRRHLASGLARGVVVNAGNANAFTGRAGMQSVEQTAAQAARSLGVAPGDIFIASTGVIGEPLTTEKIVEALPGLVSSAQAGASGPTPQQWQEAAQAIMTTDTFAKGATRQTYIGSTPVTINGIAKGSGMIAPDMATMLSFIFTDAMLPASVLQKMLTRACDLTFNCITVDSDTSTSDTVLLFATGQSAPHPPLEKPGTRDWKNFYQALKDVMGDLARQIVCDGEGASKLVTIDITGAASRRAARRIGLAVANSPLVKTAIAGGDANWGRLIMAVGKSGEKADRDRLAIEIGGHPVACRGAQSDAYDEDAVTAHMKGREVFISIDVGVGRGSSRVWTCDLTHGYIDINADYRS